MVTYIKITGWAQKISGDRKGKWHCILLMDKAAEGERGTVIIDAEGIPLGY